MRMKKDLDILLEELRKIHEDFRVIVTDKIVVEEWVRWKCKYGCKAYGKHLTCPPHTPKPDETRKLLKNYEKAIITRFDAKPNAGISYIHIHHFLWEAILKIQDTMFELERRSFLSGYYKAFALTALPCSYCEYCIPERKELMEQISKKLCEHPDKARPSMEGCGIDVFRTVRNAGYELEVLTSPDQKITLFGLLLLE
jgi:predicted metal-binding protein